MKIDRSDEALQELAGRYTALGSLRALVTETGHSYGAVHRSVTLAAQRGFCTVNGRGGARVVRGEGS